MYKRGGKWYGNRSKTKRNHDSETNAAEGSERPSKKRSFNATDPISQDVEMTYRMPTDSVYFNWRYYFYDEDYKRGSSTVKKIQAMEAYVSSNPSLFPISNLETNISYDVDINLLSKDVVFTNEWNTFKEDITNNPKHTLNCLSLAIDQVMIDAIKLTEELNNPKILGNFPKAVARVSNYRPVMPLRDLKVNSYGKLISIRGCIMRAGTVKQFPQWFEFRCKSCSTTKLQRQVDGLYTLPTKCKACNSKRFRPILDSLHTKTVNFQTIRLQEHFGDEQDDKGRRPRTIDVELMEDLIGSCLPGDDVTVTGIVKVRGSESSNSSKQNSNSNLFSLYMEAVHILNNKYKSQSKYAAGLDLTTIDHNAIREIYHEPNVFKLLVHSLCPNIYGHELIKAGLLLSLFGGCTKTGNVRDDIHVLVFGDPGLGKSQMMQACTRVASKGVYVCGGSSTSTGLTATLGKDKGSREFVLEPGALVMADKGCCCIDEFDKMSTQHQALLEAMEQQSVSLAKSGMVCCLPARTSIIAAANPAGGRYMKSKTIIENLNMSPPLLSRFDLIFILLDQPNEHLDNLLSEHVMAVHAGANTRFGDVRFRRANDELPGTGNTLREKLCVLPTDKMDPIPHSILRDYIFYAKQYVKPSLTPAAVETLQNFYLKCRAKKDREKITPMTPRQLGALIRLTVARAKLELREQATRDDALDVVAIIEHSMADVIDEPIGLDCLKSPACGKLTANKVKLFINILSNEVATKGNNTFSMSELKDIVKREKFIIDDFNTMITKLNDNGIILKKGNNLYSFSNDA